MPCPFVYGQKMAETDKDIKKYKDRDISERDSIDNR